MEHALGAAFELDQAVAVVVKGTSRHEGRQFGAEVGDLQPGDVLGQVGGVRADVTDTAAGAALLRVGAPTGLQIAGLLQGGGQPALRILHHDLADLAHVLVHNHVPRELDHRVAGVVVHETENELALLDQFLQFFCLRGGQRHRLLAHDMEAGLQEVTGDGEVPIVGRRHGHEVDALALRQGRLARNHLLVVTIDALGIEVELPAHLLGIPGIDIERSGHQLDLAVHPGGFAMHVADEGTDASTDHPHFQLPVDCHTCSFRFNFCCGRRSLSELACVLHLPKTWCLLHGILCRL